MYASNRVIGIQYVICSLVSLLYPVCFSHSPIRVFFYVSGNLFQIWVYGNSFESSLVAVANPNQQALERWADQNGVTGSFAELCEHPRAREHILAELTKIAKDKKVSYVPGITTATISVALSRCSLNGCVFFNLGFAS
jgi:hypothetical protein